MPVLRDSTSVDVSQHLRLLQARPKSQTALAANAPVAANRSPDGGVPRGNSLPRTPPQRQIRDAQGKSESAVASGDAIPRTPPQSRILEHETPQLVHPSAQAEICGKLRSPATFASEPGCLSSKQQECTRHVKDHARPQAPPPQQMRPLPPQQRRQSPRDEWRQGAAPLRTNINDVQRGRRGLPRTPPTLPPLRSHSQGPTTSAASTNAAPSRHASPSRRVSPLWPNPVDGAVTRPTAGFSRGGGIPRTPPQRRPSSQPPDSNRERILQPLGASVLSPQGEQFRTLSPFDRTRLEGRKLPEERVPSRGARVVQREVRPPSPLRVDDPPPQELHIAQEQVPTPTELMPSQQAALDLASGARSLTELTGATAAGWREYECPDTGKITYVNDVTYEEAAAIAKVVDKMRKQEDRESKGIHASGRRYDQIEDGGISLTACSFCGRKFNPKSIKRHEEICKGINFDKPTIRL